MSDEDTQETGITLHLLADGIGGTGCRDPGMGLPEFEEEFNLPVGTRQDEGHGKGQVGDIGQVEGPLGQVDLGLREGTLIQPSLFFQTGLSLVAGVIR